MSLDEAHQLDQDASTSAVAMIFVLWLIASMQVRKTMQQVQSSWGRFRDRPDSPPLATEVLNEAGMWIRELKEQMPLALNALNAMSRNVTGHLENISGDVTDQKSHSRELLERMEVLIEEVKKRESPCVRDAVGPVLTEEIIPTLRNALQHSPHPSAPQTPRRNESFFVSGESISGRRQHTHRRSHSPPGLSSSSARGVPLRHYGPEPPPVENLFAPISGISASIPRLPRQFTSPNLMSFFTTTPASQASSSIQHLLPTTSMEDVENPSRSRPNDCPPTPADTALPSQGSISYFDTEMGPME